MPTKFNLNNYKFYTHPTWGAVGFENRLGKCFMARNRRNGKWSSYYYENKKMFGANSYWIYDYYVRSGIWVEVKVGIKILE